MPAVDLEPTGGVHRLLLQSPHAIVEAPAGNGDLFETLHRAGVVEQLCSQGVAQLQVQDAEEEGPGFGVWVCSDAFRFWDVGSRFQGLGFRVWGGVQA